MAPSTDLVQSSGATRKLRGSKKTLAWNEGTYIHNFYTPLTKHIIDQMYKTSYENPRTSALRMMCLTSLRDVCKKKRLRTVRRVSLPISKSTQENYTVIQVSVMFSSISKKHNELKHKSEVKLRLEEADQAKEEIAALKEQNRLAEEEMKKLQLVISNTDTAEMNRLLEEKDRVIKDYETSNQALQSEIDNLRKDNTKVNQLLSEVIKMQQSLDSRLATSSN